MIRTHSPEIQIRRKGSQARLVTIPKDPIFSVLRDPEDSSGQMDFDALPKRLLPEEPNLRVYGKTGELAGR